MGACRRLRADLREKSIARGLGKRVEVGRSQILKLPFGEKPGLGAVPVPPRGPAAASQSARLALPCPAQALADIQFGASERAVRVNSVQSGLAGEDLRAVLTGASLPDALVVPKARGCLVSV